MFKPVDSVTHSPDIEKNMLENRVEIAENLYLGGDMDVSIKN